MLPMWIIAVLWTLIAVGFVARRPGRIWVNTYRYEILLVVLSTALTALLAGELAVRLLGHSDIDGNLYFRGHRLRPYALPIQRIGESLRTYENSPSIVVRRDEEVGWSPKPGSSNELASYNSDGIRVGDHQTVFSPKPAIGVLRIALFGDSFTHGAEVRFSETWGRFLEEDLESAGSQVEVLNFGVNGYGMDQAFLRWKKDGVKFSPDIVVMGLQLENLGRNVNIIRALYNPRSAAPFSKPRFRLNDGQLELFNQPAVPPSNIIQRMVDIDSWELMEYEGAYDSRNYVERFWQKSKFVTYLLELARRTWEDRKSEADAVVKEAELALAIIRSFSESAKASDARFFVVHLPKRGEIETVLSGDVQIGEGLLGIIASKHEYIETMPGMLEYLSMSSIDSLFMPKEHYSINGNRVVAEAIVERLKASSGATHLQ